MATESKREVTESEFYYADSAFAEFAENGNTSKLCPWCGGEFVFKDKGSAYSISCKCCDFHVSSRGI
jgi:CRISPR/Cas system-associated protein Cas10 (large subunit of type III CRISPR-Cas system)